MEQFTKQWNNLLSNGTIYKAMEHFTMGIIIEILLSNVKCTLQWSNVFLMIYDYQSSNSTLLILYIYVSVHNVKWLT